MKKFFEMNFKHVFVNINLISTKIQTTARIRVLDDRTSVDTYY